MKGGVEDGILTPFFPPQRARLDNPGRQGQSVRIPAATWQLGPARGRRNRQIS